MKATMMITIQVESGSMNWQTLFLERLLHHVPHRRQVPLEITSTLLFRFNMKMMLPTVTVNPRARSIGPCFCRQIPRLQQAIPKSVVINTQPVSLREIIVQILFPVALESLLA